MVASVCPLRRYRRCGARVSLCITTALVPPPKVEESVAGDARS